MENVKKSLIEEKSFKFAISVVKLFSELKKQNEYVLSKQFLRAGTSIGANVTEALAAQSSNDFINKMSIASKEARETRYWLNLLKESNLVKINYDNYLSEINEIIKILTKIVKTSQNNLINKSKQLKT